MRFLNSFLIAFILLPLTGLADEVEPHVSNPVFLKGAGDGWFWYKDPKEKPIVKPKEPQSPTKTAPETPTTAKKETIVPFSVEWLRINLPKLQQEAIDNPTKENISAYYYAQRVAMDKAQNYAEKAQEVVASDPFLDENNRVPIASFATAQLERLVSKGKDDALKYMAGKGGLWVFYDSKCSFCGPQVNTVKEVAKKYGFSTKFISMDHKGIDGLLPAGTWVNESGQARVLNVSITPTTIFVSPPNNYYVLSQGLMAQDGLSDRLIIAAKSNNLLSPEMLAGIQQYQRGLLKPEDMAEGASENPKEWVKKLQDRLKGRY